MRAPISRGHRDQRYAGGRREQTPTWCSTVGCLVTLSMLVASLCVDAQPWAQVPRLGVISIVSPVDPQQSPFLQKLRELGYVEGQNILIDWRSNQGSDERAYELAADLVRLKVDILVAFDGPAARGAKRVTSSIPIVMVVGDALEQGLVPSLARPGGNLTGISYMTPELSQRRLEILKESLPQIRRVAVLWCPDLGGNPLQWREVQVGAGRLGLQLQSLEVRSPDDVEPAFAAATRDGAEALFVVSCALLSRGAHRLPRRQTSAASDLRGQGGRGCWGPHGLWGKPDRDRAARRRLCRQDSARRQTSRPARGANDEIRAGHQP